MQGSRALIDWDLGGQAGPDGDSREAGYRCKWGLRAQFPGGRLFFFVCVCVCVCVCTLYICVCLCLCLYYLFRCAGAFHFPFGYCPHMYPLFLPFLPFWRTGCTICDRFEAKYSGQCGREKDAHLHLQEKKNESPVYLHLGTL